MEYAKLENGKLTKCVIFPNGMSVLNGRFKRNPTEADILAAGYLPIVETEEPEHKEGFIKSSNWVQTNSAIAKKWTVKRDMRPLSQTDISKMLIREQINTLTVDDNTALRMKQYYPDFESIVGHEVKQGYKFNHGGKLWATVKSMVIQAHYPPGEGMESLYTEVCETHSGTIDDAIPYNGNMALVNGLYYTQNGVIYLCNRDTVNPVYHALSELVGLYVVEV